MLEAVTESAVDIPIQGFDLKGNVIFWNRSSELVYGHLRKDALGKNIVELLPGREKDGSIELIKKTCLDNEQSLPIDWTFWGRNGKKRQIYSIIFPDIKRSRKCESIFSVDFDITDIIESEKKVNSQEALYKEVFDKYREGLMIIAPEDVKILDSNAEISQMLGFSREKLCGTLLYDLANGDKSKAAEKIKSVIASAFYEGPQIFEMPFSDKYKKLITVRVEFKKVKIAAKEVILAVFENFEKDKEQKKIMDVAGVMLVKLNLTGNVESINKKGCEILGYEEKEIVGKNWFDNFLSSKRTEEVKDVFFKLIDKEEVSVEFYENSILTRQGKERIILWHNAILRDNQGKVTGTLSSGSDITEMKEKENLLLKREAQLNEAQRIACLGSWEWDVLNDEITWSLHLEEILDLKQKRINNVIQDFFLRNVHLEDQEYVRMNIEKALTENEPFTLEYRFIDQKGENVYVRTIGKSLFNEQGIAEKMAGTIQDISYYKNREIQLIKANSTHLELLVNSHDLIFAVSDKGVVSSVNPAVEKILGIGQKNMLSRQITDFVSVEDKEEMRNMLVEIMRGKKISGKEIRMLHNDSKIVFLSFNAWPSTDNAGNIRGMHGIAQDITERKQVVEHMREMVIQLVAMLSETVSVADRYTEQHCERLQDFALKIGEALNLEVSRMEYLKFAALLHDVGKVGIPIHILIKKEKLTDDEWQKIKEHPKKGADIVRQLKGFEEVADIIEQHQERADGKGYPRGLKIEEIKKEASIISVVDAFDAMTSDRPYRKAMSTEEALKELRKNSGTQFDPEVVEAFIKVILEENKK
ncbi:MAG: PAS domain S-box protein [Candidatus Omnitrophica bacterium]|nr:PAS domain S-box protein [Candidatus Omnitrophota bacterium]